MKVLLSVLPFFALCGCLSPAQVPNVSHWLVEFAGSPAVAQTPKYGVARLSQVLVDLPYANDRIVVLRRDGTVSLDSYNVFVAPPSALLKSACLSALNASGLFSDVVGASSGASAAVSVELVVRRMALDCRQEGLRKAMVELHVRLLDGRTTVATAEGEGAADASSGDYGVAFSKALSTAVLSALSRLR